jgi:hypothetical protein
LSIVQFIGGLVIAVVSTARYVYGPQAFESGRAPRDLHYFFQLRLMALVGLVIGVGLTMTSFWRTLALARFKLGPPPTLVEGDSGGRSS